MGIPETGRGVPGRCFSFSRGRRLGYTLLEVVVVLVLFAVVATVVAPSLFSPRGEQSSALQGVVRNIREAAVRRGEMVHLHVDRSGAWQAGAGSPPQTELLSSGRISGTGEPVDLLFSPLGTCALTPEALPAQASLAIDPLTCEVRLR